MAGEASALAPPNVYDLASEDGDPWAAPVAGSKSRKRRSKSGTSGEPQLPLEGVQRGEWTLPPLALLTRAGEQAVNRAEIERRGQTLQESLEQHGVDTALVGMTVGPDGDPVRARARPGGQGRPRHDVAEGHRLRDGGHRCPDPGPDPGAFGDRGRGAEPPTSARRSGRPVGGAGGEDVDRPPRRRDRQGHRRPGRVPRPRHDAAPADRRRDGRREVERPQLHHHVAADAQHPRPGAPHPDRPEAGRDGSVPTAAAPADAARHQPQEGGQRARLGGEGDGPPLRHPVGGRVPRHHRLQRRVRPWGGRGRAAQRRRVPTPAVHRDRRRRAQRLDDGGRA